MKEVIPIILYISLLLLLTSCGISKTTSSKLTAKVKPKIQKYESE